MSSCKATNAKAFALQAVPTPWSGLLFQMRKGVSLNDALLSADVDRIIQWMKLGGAA